VATKIWGDGMLCALDAAGATFRTLGDGQAGAIVILDPDGKVVHCGTDIKKGSYFYNTGGAKPRVPYADLKRAMDKHNSKGLLHGLEAPPKLAPLLHAVKQGKLGTAQKLLARVPDSGDYGAAKAELLKRLEALRQQKLALFKELLSAGEPWAAYKAGASYVRCFCDAEDCEAVKSKLRALKSNPAVKKNLDARTAFRKYALACCGPRRKLDNPQRIQRLFASLASKHDGTEYGDAATRVAQ